MLCITMLYLKVEFKGLKEGSCFYSKKLKIAKIKQTFLFVCRKVCVYFVICGICIKNKLLKIIFNKILYGRDLISYASSLMNLTLILFD